MKRTLPMTALFAGTLVLTGCSEPLDFDLRRGNAPSTTEAAQGAATASRPQPDDRGVISYPNYQVAIARRGDTVSSVAERVGTDAAGLARYNGLEPGDKLRDGETIALPNRVAEPAGGPIKPGSVDITTLAGNAIDSADANNVTTSSLPPANQPRGVSGVEPVRHKVERGETAYSVARLYKVSVRSLADWNGLGNDFSVREGQYLLIPVALADAKPAEAKPVDEIETTSLPGEGTETPEPPSASQPLPDEETVPASEEVETTAAPDLSEPAPKPTPRNNARMVMPVQGSIIREYSKGRNDGIDIAASPGSAVGAADAGTVAAITEDTNGVPIIVVKHPNNVLTVYSNVDNVSVSKGQSVGRGAKLAEIRKEGTAAVHFEVREGFDSVDPGPYLGN